MNETRSQKHERDIGENPDTTEVKDAKKWNGGSRLFGQAIRLVMGQDSASRDHRPRQAHHRSNSPVKTLANSDVGGTSRDVGTTPRRRSFNRSFEKDFRGKGPRELHRLHEQTTLGVPGNPEPECGEENTMQSAVVFSDCPRTMDQEEESVPYEENVPNGSLRVPTDSAQTAKDIEILRQSQEPQFTPDGHVIIDPAVRERIANPEYPVRMPDKPFDNLSFYDYTANKGKASSNISQVHGLFGRQWRERLEKQQERQYAEEDAKSEDDVPDIRDDTCPMFMIWGICRWEDRCPLRHPPYRYLQRPKRTAPEPVHEEPKARDPNSYAAIVAKKQEEFLNDAVSKVCGMTEETFEEAWPALGSPGKGSCNTIAPKAWGPKGEAPTVTVPQVWDPLSTTKEAPWTSTVNQLQIANDELIADNLQAEEYSQLNGYDGYEADYEEDYNYYPEQGLNEDEYIEEIEEEEFNSSTYSNPVEQNSDRDSEGVAQPNIIISNVCDICLDRPKDATLVCGHRYCYQCALQMRLDERVCAICRRCIVSVIKTYN